MNPRRNWPTWTATLTLSIAAAIIYTLTTR
jgi:hypothetical protein